MVLFERQVTEPTLHVLHDPGELVGQLLHEVPAAVLLQHVEAAEPLFADLTIQLKVALRVQRVLLSRSRVDLTLRCVATGTLAGTRLWTGRFDCLEIHHRSDVKCFLVTSRPTIFIDTLLTRLPSLFLDGVQLLEALQLENIIDLVVINPDMKKQSATIGIRLLTNKASVLLRIL